jgi:hypothetical protein
MSFNTTPFCAPPIFRDKGHIYQRKKIFRMGFQGWWSDSSGGVNCKREGPEFNPSTNPPQKMGSSNFYFKRY